MRNTPRSYAFSALACILLLSLPAVSFGAQSPSSHLGPLSIEVAPGDWRPINVAPMSKAAGTAAENLFPILFFDENGQISLTKMPIVGKGVEKLFADGGCNGGQCSVLGGGGAFNCPTSGGPTCGDGESCQCQCTLQPQGGISTGNVCVKPAGGGDYPILD